MVTVRHVRGCMHACTATTALLIRPFWLPGCRKLGQNQLSGSLPGEWAGNNAFQSLTELDVSANRLDGELPDSYGAQGAFSGLQLLRLGSNAFTGVQRYSFCMRGMNGMYALSSSEQLMNIALTWASFDRHVCWTMLDAAHPPTMQVVCRRRGATAAALARCRTCWWRATS